MTPAEFLLLSVFAQGARTLKWSYCLGFSKFTDTEGDDARKKELFEFKQVGGVAGGSEWYQLSSAGSGDDTGGTGDPHGRLRVKDTTLCVASLHRATRSCRWTVCASAWRTGCGRRWRAWTTTPWTGSPPNTTRLSGSSTPSSERGPGVCQYHTVLVAGHCRAFVVVCTPRHPSCCDACRVELMNLDQTTRKYFTEMMRELEGGVGQIGGPEDSGAAAGPSGMGHRGEGNVGHVHVSACELFASGSRGSKQRSTHVMGGVVGWWGSGAKYQRTVAFLHAPPQGRRLLGSASRPA